MEPHTPATPAAEAPILPLDSTLTPLFRVLPVARKPRCLVTNLHPERGLSRALRQHLSLVLDRVEFTLEAEGAIDAIWVCGYEPDQRARVAELRARHPDVMLLVTGGHIPSGWEQGVLDVGANHAREWPLSFDVLGSLLVGHREIAAAAS
jgi:hypothetical protein